MEESKKSPILDALVDLGSAWAAHGLDAGSRLTDAAVAALRPCRDQFADGLAALGLAVRRPEATYFCTSDISAVGEDDAVAFCWSFSPL